MKNLNMIFLGCYFARIKVLYAGYHFYNNAEN
jgi:hypothetical protein